MVINMRMLDIDMDFFQTEIHNFDSDKDTFLNDDRIKVWPDEKIVKFLEEQCGLDKNNKIKGRIVKHHVEAFSFWQELVNIQKDITPFSVTHIDAHSDLAFSASTSYYKFLKSLDKDENQIKLRNGEIFDGQEHLIDSGNYLLDAIIMGWIKKVNYVFHPDLDYLDVFDYIVECVKSNKLFRFNFCDYIKNKNILLELIHPTNYRSKVKYDYIAVALSPSFVKKEMVEKLEILKDYIEFI